MSDASTAIEFLTYDGRVYGDLNDIINAAHTTGHTLFADDLTRWKNTYLGHPTPPSDPPATLTNRKQGSPPHH